MDQVRDYCTLIREGLDSYVTLSTKYPTPDYQVIRVYDDEHQRYIIQKLGWKESKRIEQTMLHVALRDGKIWIEEDWTEDGIATFFLEHGVPRNDIVLGFQPPNMRPYTEFAVA